MAYAQTGSYFEGKFLGKSGLSYHDFGCVSVDVLNALGDAGYEIDPGAYADKMNEIGAFTPDGLLIWGKVSEAYPQFHYGNGPYRFVQGAWGKFLHWLLEDDKGTTDPWTGGPGAPAGFAPTGQIRYASIDAYVAPEVATEQPTFQEYTVQPGDTLGHIIASHYGLDSWADISAKIPAVCEASGISDANAIHPGQVIKLP